MTHGREDDGIEQYDVSILKLLYLIRYVDDLKANVDNIAILMVDDIRADKINMRKAIQESLDRLVRENYVARHGETYTFLTDDEQDIERDIRNTPIDSAAIVQSIAQIVFGDLYVSKKFKYGKYDFPYDQIIDDTAIGQLSGSIRLRIITVASDLFTAQDQMLLMKSNRRRHRVADLRAEGLTAIWREYHPAQRYPYSRLPAQKNRD